MRVDKDKVPLNTSELRRQAEALWHKKKAVHPSQTEDALRLIQELEIHQIELEMQREELIRTRDEMNLYLDKYTNLYEFAPVGYLTLDRIGVIRDVNLTGAGLLDAERTKLLGRDFRLFIADESKPLFVDFLQKMFERQGKDTCEVVLARKGNLPCVVHIEALLDVPGELCNIVLVDITEKKMAQAVIEKWNSDLREKENQFRLQVEVVKDFAVFTLDINGNVQSWNAGAERMKGYRVEEIIDKHFSCFYTQEDRDAGKPGEDLKIAAAKGQITDEGWRVDKNGSKLWAEVIITALHDERGNLRGFSKVTRNITNRKGAEDALRVSEAYYRSLFADNPSMIFTLDSELTTLSVSPLGASFLGYTPDELQNQSVMILIHKDDRFSVAEQFRWCLKNPGQVHRLQFQTVRKDGSRVWVLEIAQGVYDTRGTLNILVVCQDISDIKRAEEEIKRLNADLAARAVEFEVANKELETFNYTVAHDLRQPLNLLCLICQKINVEFRQESSAEYLADVRRIHEVTLRMDKLIGALLNFSRIGYVEPLRTKVDLSKMAHEVATELAQTEPERQVEFRIADGLTSYVDAGLMRLVLDNLLGNAWKYTREQEKVVIEFGLTDIDGVPTCFIRDNGSGFVKEDADRLFVPFQRLPGAEKAIGFGIGLATVERIIRRHGGRVWAESELGKGATVYFTLLAQDATL